MTVTKHGIRRGAYYDSVVLMQLQRGLIGLPGIVDAGVVMATQANCDLLAANTLLPDSVTASPDDLLIVVKAENDSFASGAMDKIDSLLTRRSSVSQDFRPRSLSGAAKQLPEANWVLVSVPGRYAAGVAREALELGKHVFLYSDNVSIEEACTRKGIAGDGTRLRDGDHQRDWVGICQPRPARGNRSRGRFRDGHAGGDCSHPQPRRRDFPRHWYGWARSQIGCGCDHSPASFGFARARSRNEHHCSYFKTTLL